MSNLNLEQLKRVVAKFSPVSMIDGPMDFIRDCRKKIAAVDREFKSCLSNSVGVAKASVQRKQ